MSVPRYAFRVVLTGVLGFGLILVDIYYEFVWQGKSLGFPQGSTKLGVDNGVYAL
jgi:hypothetical protein